MSDAPENAEDLVAWFRATEIVRHDGSRSPREPYMSLDEALILASKIGQPHYFDRSGHTSWDAHDIWSMALEMNLFMHDRFGWIDREGRFWGCGHAAHEMLLHFLGLEVCQAEMGGWIRISMSGPQSIFTPSDAQLSTLIQRGDEGTAKHMLAEGLRPNRADVKAARVASPTTPIKAETHE